MQVLAAGCGSAATAQAALVLALDSDTPVALSVALHGKRKHTAYGVDAVLHKHCWLQACARVPIWLHVLLLSLMWVQSPPWMI
jgi:hypothetical protein